MVVCGCSYHSGKGQNGNSSGIETQTAIRYARGFRITESGGYAIVTLRDPWDTLRTRCRYILVPRDSVLPGNLPEGTVIRTPLKKAVIYTTTIASLLEQAGCIDNICGICEKEYVTSKETRRRISSGAIADLGKSTSPNVEKIVEMGADAIIASPFQNSGYGPAGKVGIPIIEAADYLENHPLGRAEWIRFYSLLFGKGSTGDSLFNVTEERYNALKSLAGTAKKRPTVMLERRYAGQWPMPAGNSYVGTMHRDAGADYIFCDLEGGESVPLSYETVLDRASEADYWLLKYNSPTPLTYGELAEEYPPYKSFGPFANQSVYACNTGITTYYDDISLHPDYILADFIHIYHPELLPDHKPKYYFPLAGQGQKQPCQTFINE